jgi:hypothetical protein
VVWLVAPKSTTQSVTSVGGARAIKLKEPVRDCGSHSNHSVKGSNCYGEARGRGKGGVNGGPAYCTGESY